MSSVAKHRNSCMGRLYSSRQAFAVSSAGTFSPARLRLVLSETEALLMMS